MTTRAIYFLHFSLTVTLTASCNKRDPAPTTQTDKPLSFAEARSGFETKLIRRESQDHPVPEPPHRLFDLVRYQSGPHQFPAYVSPDPGDGDRHPVIIWLVGGFHNSISGNAFEAGPRDNDQSGATFRKAGILMMYPSMRGGSENSGSMEAFLGEVDDVLAAANHLKSLDYIDPDRIYLGGHSTGGTLALLAAAASGKTFRAVFSLGPIDDPAGYGRENLPYDVSDDQERRLRAPVRWLHSIAVPTFCFEGEDGNVDSLRALEKANSNPRISFFPIRDAGHFDIIAPVSEVLAGAILVDDDPEFSADIGVSKITQRLTRLISPPRKSFPPGDPRSDRIEFEFAVYLPKETTRSAAMKLVKDLVESEFPELQWREKGGEATADLEVLGDLIEDVPEGYAPPSMESLRYKGRGLSKEQAEALQESQQAISLFFRHPGDRSLDGIRNANQLILRVAVTVGGFPWDEETREVFSTEAWKERRVAKWDSGFPKINNHITIHAYQNGEHIRAITLGMEKFGLPDVAVDQFSWAQNRTMGILVNCVCQAMVEGTEIANPEDFELDLRSIQHSAVREPQVESFLENATGKARLALKLGAWDLGDPGNRLIEILPDHYDGPDLLARYTAMVSDCFGSSDSIQPVDHDNTKLQAASARAKAKLPQLRKDHNAGLAPGEYILVKAPFAVPGGGNEYMWVEVVKWDDETIRGSLRSDPFNIPDLKAGQEVTVKESEVFDYIRHFPDGSDEGNETGKVILEMSGKK